MNSNSPIEQQLESLGQQLRARPRLVERAMDELRRGIGAPAAEKPVVAKLVERRFGPSTFRSRRSLITIAGLVLAVSAAFAVLLMLSPSTAVGWPDLVNAEKSQNWIRAKCTFPNGGTGVYWFSPPRHIWAFQFPDALIFNDGRERAHYEYYLVGRVGLEMLPGKRSILKLPLGEQTAQDVLPFAGVSAEKTGYWLFGTEKILSQGRRNVTENGRSWIEIEMVLWRGEMNHATLRVDPATRLPIDMVCRSPDGKKSMKYMFDYPQEGPTDIYALGVPRDVKIDDRMPPSNVQQVLDRMATSRASIGDFRLDIAADYGSDRIVWRKGAKWRVDSCLYVNNAYERAIAVRTGPTKGQSLRQWFDARLSSGRIIPWYRCDGRAVWENTGQIEQINNHAMPKWKLSGRAAPQDLMSSNTFAGGFAPDVHIAGLLFPDLTPQAGWGFEFVAAPADAPGCVLIKRSARGTISIAHEWYYIDPAKGYAVVREELFNGPHDTPDDAKSDASQQSMTVSMDGFEHTPHGFWYPTVVRSVTRNAKGHINGQPTPAGYEMRETTRYLFDFKTEIPDSLFEGNGAEK